MIVGGGEYGENKCSEDLRETGFKAIMTTEVLTFLLAGEDCTCQRIGTVIVLTLESFPVSVLIKL